MEFTGKTVAEAVVEGLKALGIKEEEAQITVIEEAVKGLFGKVKKPARVEITAKRTESEPASAKNGKEENPAACAGEDGERAAEFLNGLFEKMGVIAKATVKAEGEEKIEIEILAENSATIIGHRGETLDALQTLAGAAANVGKAEYKRVAVNCEGYRERREDSLIKLAHRLEEKATRYGRDVSLEPMSPYERRVIHAALAESATVTTTSEGKEPNRYVVIVPNEKKPQTEGYGSREKRYGGQRDGGRKYGDRRHGDRDRGGRDRDAAPKRKAPTAFGTFLGNFKEESENGEEE